MSRVLIVSTDYFGKSMAGPAIRCWEMARLLVANGHQARIGAKTVADPEPEGFDVFLNSPESLAEATAWADVVVIQGLALLLYPVLLEARRLLVDIYDPFNLEILELFRDAPWGQRMDHHTGQLGALIDQLHVGDYFLCASERQRDYWLGALTATRRVNPYTHGQDDKLRRLVDVAPFGIRADPVPEPGEPVARGVIPGFPEDARIAIWGGGIYNWFDPLSLLRAWPAVVEAVPQARLLFLGVGHPNPDVPQMAMAVRAIDLSKSLGLSGRSVHFNLGWVPYEERRRYLAEARVGVSMHFDHVETAFSFRTRILDYIWAGLPTVATTGDEFARWISDNGTGRTVGFEDVPAISAALIELLGDDNAYGRAREAVIAERPSFTWERALQPLLAYCADPWPAPDLAAGRARRQDLIDRPRTRARRALDRLAEDGPVGFARWAFGVARRRVSRRARSAV